jgi:hypothetical protein
MVLVTKVEHQYKTLISLGSSLYCLALVWSCRLWVGLYITYFDLKLCFCSFYWSIMPFTQVQMHFAKKLLEHWLAEKKKQNWQWWHWILNLQPTSNTGSQSTKTTDIINSGYPVALRRSCRLQQCVGVMNKPVTVYDQMSPTLPWFAKEA